LPAFLESLGFEYLAVDLDPARIRLARNAGDTVVLSATALDEELLRRSARHRPSCGLITLPIPRSPSHRALRAPACAPTCACWCAPRMMSAWRN